MPRMTLDPDIAAAAGERPAPPEVRVGVVSPMLAPAVRALQVAPEQLQFVGDTAYNLEQTRLDPNSEAMAVLAGERVVGFYRLDFSVEAIAGRALGEPVSASRRHPQRRLLALTVNVRNQAAIAVYLKAGFYDTGELYHGGSAGPQHLMLYRLAAAPSPSPTATAP